MWVSEGVRVNYVVVTIQELHYDSRPEAPEFTKNHKWAKPSDLKIADPFAGSKGFRIPRARACQDMDFVPALE